MDSCASHWSATLTSIPLLGRALTDKKGLTLASLTLGMVCLLYFTTPYALVNYHQTAVPLTIAPLPVFSKYDHQPRPRCLGCVKDKSHEDVAKEVEMILQKTNKTLYITEEEARLGEMAALKKVDEMKRKDQLNREVLIAVEAVNGATKVYWDYLLLMEQSGSMFSHCAYSNCRITRDWYKRRRADMVVSVFDGTNPPTYRRHYDYSRQVSVFHTMESEQWQLYRFPAEDDTFNYSMTYKLSSDIPVPFYCRNEYFQSPSFFLREDPFLRKKAVLGLISNCRPQRRLWYVNQLSVVVQTDVYGRCGKPADWCVTSKDKFGCEAEHILHGYKFYLSFENSECQGYITEKLFKSFQYFLIPVVMGAPRSDYEALLPPRSFIHTDDFPGPMELGAYLLRVMTDRTLFDSYHAWRYTMYRFPLMCTSRFDTCELCKLANEKPRRQMKMSTFWNKDRNCLPFQ